MRKKILVVWLALTLIFASAGVVSTQADLPVGGCPDGFMLMAVMDHEHEHGEHHLGLHVDINDDGNLCVLHVSPTRHVHVDNFAVLP